MNAAVVHTFNAPPRYTSFSDPIAASNEVIVSVCAAGLHRVVKSLASGVHYGSTGALPLIPGVDGVGRLKDGKRVYFGVSRSSFGTFAQYCVTEGSFCLPIPDALDDVTVAAMMNPGMSSWAALKFRAQFVAGENVLILGATGVAGQLAIQVAKRLGAGRIVAAGRNPQALEEAKRLGADALISLDQNRESVVSALRQEWSKSNIDIILDYTWGEPAERVFEALSTKGLRRDSARIRYIQIGASAAPAISLPASVLRSTGIELLGSGFNSVSIDKIFESAAAFLQEAARSPFQIRTKAAPLREVEALWNSPDQGTRVVFQP
ncbi:MAG: zinc-binding alcohol dehydrogenase family protein [Candidatus Acidiferrales bacterium]